jgi:branched-chain amino acid transport system substrate-binding protein
VGFICSCTGSALGAFIVPAEDEYKAWVNAVNATGGINGHPVRLIVEDDATNPGNSVTAIQTLISDHVVAIVDTSAFDTAWASKVQSANIPVVGGYTSMLSFGMNPDFYPEGQTNDSAIYSVLATAKAAGASSLADLYCAEGCSVVSQGFPSTGQKLGVPVVYSAAISSTAPNYTAQCVAAQQRGAKSVIVGDASAIIARVATDCARQNYIPTFVQEMGAVGLNLASVPGLKDSLRMESPTLPFFANTAAVQESNAAMDKYFPGVRQNNNLFVQDDFTLWVSGKLLEAAIKTGGLTPSDAPTAAEVVSGLQSLKGDTLGGLTSPLTFAAGKPHTVDCWFTARFQNGGIPTLENNSQPVCEPGS